MAGGATPLQAHQHLVAVNIHQFGIPTIGFGPGEERYVHTVDDQVRLRDLESAAQVYAELAARMLRQG